MSVPSNSTEVWFGNDTFRILQNMDLGINLTCESRYPIQWVETYDKESDGLGGVRPASLVKGLWNEVVEGAEDETWSYRTVFSSQFSGSVCSVSNYTCQAVDDLCLRTNVILHLDQATDLVNMHLTQGPNRDDELQRRTEVGKEDECAAIVSYWLHPMKPHYGWKCEIASSGKIITDRNQFLICDSAAHCNTFYRHQRMVRLCIFHPKYFVAVPKSNDALNSLKQGTKCLRRVADCYYYCAYTNDNSYKPGFVTCRDQGILLAQHYFYSVPQTPHETPEIYFDWSEADPQKMLVIEPLSNETYLMDTVTVFCQLSRYYFAYGHRFAVGSENGSVDYKMAVDGEYVEVYNTNRINLTIELTTLGAVDVYCLAPVWNSTDWVNQSISINVLPDPEPPSFAFTEDEEETLVWFTGDSNKSIICRGQGKPSPVVRWSDVVPGSKYVENSVDKTTTEIEFPIVSDEVEGEYVCEAENFLKISRKTFRVVVIDPFKLVVKTVSIVASCVLMLCLVVMFLCWKTIRDQRKQIRLLSEAEIKEFLEGNIEAVQSNDYLDTSDLIQSLPYNPKFEIPKEMIHIDQSKVLGSGNFGQVLKGSIQLLDSQNGSRSMKTALKGMNSIDVAVKTVKHNMEVLYFKTLLSEVKIMAYIGSHPNICSLVGACTQNIRKREIFIAVEFCTNGSLEHYLRKQRPVFINLVKNDAIVPQEPKQRNPYENVDAEYGGADMTNNKLTPITTQNLIKWSREIANGMEFLGSKKIIHGDLATRNVFLSDELVVKIGDFGLSRQLLNYSNYIKNQEVNACGHHKCKFCSQYSVWITNLDCHIADKFVVPRTFFTLNCFTKGFKIQLPAKDIQPRIRQNHVLTPFV
ncbi:uncharacterized protein LOC118436188 [Folsomia candida]|uniref:uncharacterized protein LOC118436188 n=1 Tax=Folsomia candida TaxID=158441 RepID=UPI001604EA09|nr:uncharacterized protein LOC118436188 [Folsomia candida]